MVVGLEFLFLIFILACNSLHWAICISDKPLVLLVSFDGFRWDYLQRHRLLNFNSLKLNGTHADYIYNSFSTVTFPNHWTIVTGLYEESHGITQNIMFDPVLNKTFSYVSPDSQKVEWYGQNKQAEPIWITNQKGGGGRRSAAEWVGSNLKFNGEGVINIPYNKSTPYKELVDRFIQFYTDPSEPINFGALYFDEPDHTGHLFGPFSKEMELKLKEMDDVLGYLIQSLRSNGLYDKLNLIITSDHGMDTISKETAIFLDSHIDTDLFDAYGSRACYSLFIKKASDLEYVYKTLKQIKNIDVYKKSEIPDSLHYKLNVRIGDLIIVTKAGYCVYINNQTVNWNLNKGDHGYYNNESSMFPIFMAHGPAIKKSHKIASFKNVDIYPLICLILGVDPAPNNGTIENIIDMLELTLLDYQLLLAFGFIAILPMCIIAKAIVMFIILIIEKSKSIDGGCKKEQKYDSIKSSNSDFVIRMGDSFDSNDKKPLVGGAYIIMRN